MDYSLPSEELLREQAAWLAPARSRLLRRADIARRQNVLDLGCGSGAVTGELVRRAGGKVTALDCREDVFTEYAASFAGAACVCGRAEALPLADHTFDLVFCQFAFLWFDAPAAVREIRRVLAPGGALVALEPDYGGMIEYPPEIALGDVWTDALRRAGADPCVGRKLPVLLSHAGFRVHVDLPDRLMPPSPLRFRMIEGLPLMPDEKKTLRKAEKHDAEMGDAPRVVHLPVFFLHATAE